MKQYLAFRSGSRRISYVTNAEYEGRVRSEEEGMAAFDTATVVIKEWTLPGSTIESHYTFLTHGTDAYEEARMDVRGALRDGWMPVQVTAPEYEGLFDEARCMALDPRAAWPFQSKGDKR